MRDEQQPYKGTFYPGHFLEKLAGYSSINWEQCEHLADELAQYQKPDTLLGWGSPASRPWKQRAARGILVKAKKFGVSYYAKDQDPHAYQLRLDLD